MNIELLNLGVSFVVGFALASILWGSLLRTAQKNCAEAIRQTKSLLETVESFKSTCARWEALYNRTKP